MLQRKKRLKGFWKAILILNKTNTFVLSAAACFSGVSERCRKKNRVGYVTKNITGKMNLELNIEISFYSSQHCMIFETVMNSLQISCKAFSTDIKSGACRGEKFELLKRYIDEKIYNKAGA